MATNYLSKLVSHLLLLWSQFLHLRINLLLLPAEGLLSDSFNVKLDLWHPQFLITQYRSFVQILIVKVVLLIALFFGEISCHRLSIVESIACFSGVRWLIVGLVRGFLIIGCYYCCGIAEPLFLLSPINFICLTIASDNLTNFIITGPFKELLCPRHWNWSFIRILRETHV